MHRHLDAPRDVDRQPRGAGIRAAGMELYGMKGQEASDWIVVDLGEVIVHVMQEESRRLYELEKLWS
nr:ribosome silencing factor [Serratia marcescens]